jgi:hypothetical protein
VAADATGGAERSEAGPPGRGGGRVPAARGACGGTARAPKGRLETEQKIYDAITPDPAE